MEKTKPDSILSSVAVVDENDPRIPKPAYGCEKCGGSGVVLDSRGDVSGLCECKRSYFTRRKLSALPRRIRQMTFDTFDPRDEKQGKLKRAAMKYVNDFNPESKGLIFFGGPGGGKTHIMSAIYQALAPVVDTSFYFYFPELLNFIRTGYEVDEVRAGFEKVKDCDLLWLDDFGKERSTEWVQEQVNLLVEARYLYDKKILMTTNLEFNGQQWNQVVDRAITSRLIETCTIVDCSNMVDQRRKEARYSVI